MKVGDVFWVELPSRGGHAQSGRRPAIVAQAGEISQQLPTVILIPLTTQIDALRFAGTLLVEPDGENGLKRPSVALVFQIAAVDRRFVGNRVGQVSDEIVQEMWKSLDELMGRISNQ